jgi:predicted nucleic acid-binding protein
MCLLLVDAMVWNYLGKAKVLSSFLSSLPATPITLTEVEEQLRSALSKWPELDSILAAVKNQEIEVIELDQEEEELRTTLLTRFQGLGVVDCGLLAVALRRGWKLLTCDQALQKKAVKMDIETVELEQLLNEALEKGCISYCDQMWVLDYSRGHVGHRDS